MQRAIKKDIWKFIEQEFNRNKQKFNKPAVSICVYSSFFGGGNNGMMKGIQDSYRKDMGYTPSEFKKDPTFPEIEEISRTATETMQGSEIIDHFPTIANHIKTT